MIETMRLFLSISLFLFLTTPSSNAAGPSWPQFDIPRFWILGEGNTHFGVEGSYFRSKENYNANGIVIQPTTMEELRYGLLKFHLGYGFTPRISIFAQADIRGIFASNSRGSYISDDDNYGIGDVFLASRLLLYRSKSGNKYYPTEWIPESLMLLGELSWLFPAYDRAQNGKPPLGNQSNDFTSMLRSVWYANEWLAVSGGAGFTYRTASYANEIPWNIRADFMFQKNQRYRLWADFHSTEALAYTSNVFNPKQPDPIPGGSLLFKSEAPTQRWVNLGVGYLLSKRWEISGSGLFTASGMNAAKGVGGILGLVYRPYQVPEVRYESYRQEKILREQKETTEYTNHKVLHRGLKATVLKVSVYGNFFKIGFGASEGIKEGDLFEVYPPDDFKGTERKPFAYARVVNVRLNTSFLRVEQNTPTQNRLVPGCEARRITLEETVD